MMGASWRAGSVQTTAQKERKSKMSQDTTRILAAGLASVIIPVGFASIGQPISVRGISWLIAGALVIVSLASLGGSARAHRLGKASMVFGIATWAMAIALSLVWPSADSPFLRTFELPSGEPASRLGRLVAERDVALVGVRLARLTRSVTSRELDGFAPSLSQAYDELDADGMSSAPFVRTVLGRQRPDAFDAVVHEVPDSTRYVIFLHGFGGLFASYCGVVARAAASERWSTICPAGSFAGHFRDDESIAIVETSIAWARRRGAQSILLAGLSNGAAGAARLASRLDNLDGLVLISGVDPRAPHPPCPTLIWHGLHDERFFASSVRQWAEQLPHAELVLTEGDHFALLKRRTEFNTAFTRFLRGL